MYKIFLVVPPGLEQVAMQEVRQKFPQLSSSIGNEELEFECDLDTIYKLNLNLRIPNRILVRFAEFDAKSFQDLFTQAVRLPWKQFLQKKSSIQVRTTCHKSKLYHSDAVTQRIHQAIESNLGSKIPLVKGKQEFIDKNQQLIIVRNNHDHLTISIDSSGNPLYMRGYRDDSTKAPIRENLAAAIILASKWSVGEPLIDPFCGSGTIPIEAALIAANIPPGMYRDFAFEKWPDFSQDRWQSIRRAHNPMEIDLNTFIMGSDRNNGAIQAAIKNSENARVNQLIKWKAQAISNVSSGDQPGWIITNPPYGVRISSNNDIRNLYAQFGNKLREDFIDWNIIFLCNNATLVHQTHLKTKSLLSFSNGGINVQAYFSKIK